ncbi:uncharacterized protein EDB91DRAFT_1086656 [Suillus paluster]|uniref:uncharacterized protein n=1 Tax=Suillus paluster TaxID=48578 RepID=UPI001B872C2C|nr:uncharacterized protein EDB91DRAFT_1086656 [Suillus paluster]KAG1726803.1 hypothetical protein EDB91DRAFT_1086656 [Suillus paluster]
MLISLSATVVFVLFCFFFFFFASMWFIVIHHFVLSVLIQTRCGVIWWVKHPPFYHSLVDTHLSAQHLPSPHSNPNTDPDADGKGDADVDAELREAADAAADHCSVSSAGMKEEDIEVRESSLRPLFGDSDTIGYHMVFQNTNLPLFNASPGPATDYYQDYLYPAASLLDLALF